MKSPPSTGLGARHQHGPGPAEMSLMDHSLLFFVFTFAVCWERCFFSLLLVKEILFDRGSFLDWRLYIQKKILWVHKAQSTRSLSVCCSATEPLDLISDKANLERTEETEFLKACLSLKLVVVYNVSFSIHSPLKGQSVTLIKAELGTHVWA